MDCIRKKAFKVGKVRMRHAVSVCVDGKGVRTRSQIQYNLETTKS